MKLSTKLTLSAALVAALFVVDAGLDDSTDRRQAVAAEQLRDERRRQASRARELHRLLDQLETRLGPAPAFPVDTSGRADTETRQLFATLADLAAHPPAAQPGKQADAGTLLRERLNRLSSTWQRHQQSPATGDMETLHAELLAAEAALTDYLLLLHDVRDADAAVELSLVGESRIINFSALVVYIGLIGILLWVWRRDIIQPLRQMEQDARNVHAGLRSGVRLHHSRNDELGAVAHAFNEALDVLQSTAYTRTELERLVAERSTQLRESEALLQRVIDGSGQGFWDWNIVTGKVTFSGNWAGMLGYRLDEIEHAFATWERLLHPDDRPAAVAAVWAHIKGTSPTYEVEHRMLTKDGAWKWVLTRGLIVERDATGRAIHLSGTHTDIHARKLADQSLRQREELLRLVSDNFPEGALYQFVVGPDGTPRNTYAGEGFRRILGIAREEPIDNWHWLEQHVLPEDLPMLRAIHQRAISNREPLHHELRARTAGGELKWLSFRSHPRDGGDGTTIWDGVMIDVTRLKQAEAAIAQQVDFHAALNATTVDLLNRRERDDLLQAIVERTAFLLNVPHVELALLEGDELVTRAYAGRDPGVLGDRATRAQAPLSWRAVDTRQPAVTDDYLHMPGARAEYSARGTRVAAVFPILHGATCLGILGLVRTQVGELFTLGDLQKGQLLAQIVALVLHNSTIYADAVRVAESRMQALLESERRLREAQRIAHIGHWEYPFVSGDGTELWSDETYRIFGLEPQSVAIDRDRFNSFIHPDDLPRVRAAIATAFEHLEILDLRYRIIRPDGSVREIADSGEPTRDAHGTIIGMQGIIQDVTERAAAEASLRASELRFKRVVENIGDALIVDDTEGRIVFANDRFLEMFRLRTEDLPGRTIFDHVLPEQREATRATHLARLAGAPSPALLEVEALRADGTRFWVEIRVTSVIENDRVIGSQAALRDITERRAIEQTLRLLSTGAAHLSGDAFFDYVTTRLATLLGADLAFVASLQPGAELHLRTLAFSVDGVLRDAVEIPLPGSLAGAVLRERAPVLAASITQAFPQDRFLADLGVTSATAVPLLGNTGEVKGLIAICSRQAIPNLGHADSVLQLAAVRLAAEIARGRNERQFRDLFDFAPDAIVMVQRTGQIGRINRRAAALFGYSGEELTGQPFSVLVPASAPEAQRLLAEQFATAPCSRAMGEHAADLTACRKDGTAFPAEISLGPVEAESGPLIAVAIRDISERKQAERAILESEERFHAVFMESPIMILLLSFPEGRIVEANAAAERGFGIKLVEAVGRTSSELMVWVDHEDRRRYLNLLKTQRHVTDFETRLRRRDGDVFTVLFSGSLIEIAGQRYTLNSIQDITAQRQTESRLRQSQKMESLGTLAGGIAHDFNNILTGMFGFIEMACLDLPSHHPAQQWLRNTTSAGARAKDLVKQILTFSRQQEGERVPIDAATVVAEALHLLRSTLPPMVRIEENLSRDTPAVLADGTQLHQVIMNLGTNAWHAMPESGGTLRVAVTATVVSAEMQVQHPELPLGETVRITVADDGCGMPAEVFERIFEPFYTTKPAGQGTGLGLSVVHGVIRSHGGAILVRSQPGAGTTFDIYLPAIPSLATEDPVRTAPPRGQGQRLLLVDDENVGREAMAALLEHLGYRVEHFEQPQVALTRFAAQPGAYAAVLTDFAMPQVTGAEFTRQVRLVRPDIPVLLITGYVDPVHQADMRRSGLSHVLRKPPTLEELAEAVHRCINSDAASPAS